MNRDEQKRFTEYLRDYITAGKQEKIEQVLANRTYHVTVVMEDIFQPHNASAVIRTAECFGLQEVHVIENEYRFVVTNTISMGSAKWIDVMRYNNTQTCLEQLRNKGYRIVATTPHKKAKLLPELALEGKMALVFGTENVGLTDYVMNEADEFVKIPMYGFTESFNVSVSVAIFLQDIMNRLHNSSIHWQLTQEQKELVRLEWFKRIVRAWPQLEQKFLEGDRE